MVLATDACRFDPGAFSQTFNLGDTMITVTFYNVHFLEDDIHDGDIPRDDVRTGIYVTDDVFEAAMWIKREGLRFDATGADWAADPDGSRIVNYVTGERVEQTAHISDTTEDEFDEIVRIVDAN